MRRGTGLFFRLASGLGARRFLIAPAMALQAPRLTRGGRFAFRASPMPKTPNGLVRASYGLTGPMQPTRESIRACATGPRHATNASRPDSADESKT